MAWEMVSRRQHLELRERKGVLLPREQLELAKMRVSERCNCWYPSQGYENHSTACPLFGKKE